MKLLKKALAFSMLLLVLSPLTQAQGMMELGALQNMGAINKGQISGMLDQMVKSGRISEDDAKRAKEKLGSMSDSDMKNLSNEAMKRVKSGNIPRMPSSN
ncbi:MAG: hypothetical protein GY909_07875 [Oligoflexia bacterium]|nr:hypothetical protein [Oligoflexia bacterium]